MTPSRQVRVAFCLDSFAIGGTELNAVRTAEALNAERVQLHIFHLQTRGPLRSRYEQLGVPMTHLPIPNLYSPRTVLQGMRFAKMLRHENMDVVHSHDIYCNIFMVPWARFLSRCAIIASRRWGHEAAQPKLSRADRWSYSFADRVLANSSGVARLLDEEEAVPRKKIVEIPNFLADSAFAAENDAARSAERRKWGIPDGAFVAGIVARLAPVKNHALLLNALAQLDTRFHLVVVGDGPSRAELENLATRLGIDARVHFAGEMVSSKNLHQWFDVSVLCSFSEGFPNSLIEAMAAARPVVATAVGGVTDVVTHGTTGMLVPVDDPAQLAEALRLLESEPALRQRLGEAGRETVRQAFRREVVIEKLSTLYQTLADRRQPPVAEKANG